MPRPFFFLRPCHSQIYRTHSWGLLTGCKKKEDGSIAVLKDVVNLECFRNSKSAFGGICIQALGSKQTQSFSLENF